MSSSQSTAEWHDLGPLQNFAEGSIVACEVKGLELIVVRSAAGVSCFLDQCAHQPIKLSEFGEVYRGQLVCHAHGARFDLADGGKPLCHPAREALRGYPTRLEGDNLQVFL